MRIALDALAGLHAAHELVDERGRHVGLVHRDISPQNILVGVDGLARVADFGIAKFSNKKSETSEGSLKGKLAYMAPEYLRGESIDRRFDVFAVGIVLWESLAGKRLFRGANEAETVRLLLDHQPASLASVAPAAAALDGVVMTALARALDERFQNAQAMAAALETTALAAGLVRRTHGGRRDAEGARRSVDRGAPHARASQARARAVGREPDGRLARGAARGDRPRPARDDREPRRDDARTSRRRSSAAPHDARNATAMAPTIRERRRPGVPPTVAVPATVAPPTAVPSTQPMTPRMAGAPGAERTLSSASAPPPAGAPRASACRRWRRRTPGTPGGSQPRLDVNADTQLSFNEPSARTAHDVSAAGLPRTSRVVPVVAGLAVVLVAVVGIALRRPRREDEDRGARRLREPSAPRTARRARARRAVGLTATATPSATASASPTPRPPTRRDRGLRRTARRPHARLRHGAAAAADAAAASARPRPPATTKKPPPNPYASE